MKKLLLVSLAFVTIGLTSCRKDYTCTCTTVDNDPNYGGSSTATITFTAKKKDAKTICSNYESSVTVGGYTETTTCVLN